MTAYEDYLSWVKEITARYKTYSRILDKQYEILPSDINRALALFYTNLIEAGEDYQDVKINQAAVEDDYQRWYDAVFMRERDILQSQLPKSVKIAVKEIEIALRKSHDTEYYEWKEKLTVAEAKTRYMLRIVDGIKRYDSILVAISMNMRSELRALSIESRSNSQHKIRQTFPDQE